MGGIGWLARGGYRVTQQQPDLLPLLLTVIAFTIAWPTITATHSVNSSLLPVLAAMEVVPLLVMRRAPFAAWGMSAVGAVVWWQLIAQLPTAPMPWPVMHFLVLLTTVLVAAMLAELIEVMVVVIASVLLCLLAMPNDQKAWAVGIALFAIFGLLMRWLVLSRRELARQSEETELERARRAILEERSRIARELHDVVAHHMSMVVVQAQSAPVRLTEVSDETRAEFARIESSARQALNEVRGVLGVLRQEGSTAETAPQPGLEQLPELLEATRAAGVDLTWRLALRPQECPRGTALVLHRIVQESLTNATRHSPGAPVVVTLDGEASVATLAVRNGLPTGPLTEGGDRGTGGNGIPGMTSRAEAMGGHLRAEPTPDGGFVVQVQVPLEGRPRLTGLG